MMGDREQTIKAWHFLPSNQHLRNDASDLKVMPGYTYYITDAPIMCQKGMHASIKPLDALYYAPGPIITRVILSGIILKSDDKIVAQNREVIWLNNATETLREFACDCALDVAHLWKMPKIVREYLETRDDSLRAAAWDAAWAAARDAARDAAWDAAWAAARDAARDAAQDAAWAAARDAAWDAAWAAARAAAWDAAWGKQNKRLAFMLNKLKP